MLRGYSNCCFLLAKVVSVGDGIYVYECCPSCFSRTFHDENKWLCMKCHKTYDVADFRYRVPFVISDGRQLVDVTVFGSLLDPYFGCSASDFDHGDLSFGGLKPVGSFFKRHAEKIYGSYHAQIQVKTAVKESFIGNSFWFGFTKPVSHRGVSVQFHYKLEPIVHQCSCLSGLIARHMVLLSTDRDCFIPVFNRLLLSECLITDCKHVSSFGSKQVDCDNELTPVCIKPIAELGEGESAGNVLQLTCERAHREWRSQQCSDCTKVSVGDGILIESFSRQLMFESEETDFNKTGSIRDDMTSESHCLSSDDLFSDSSVFDYHVNASIDDLFPNESTSVTELENLSQSNNSTCLRNLCNFADDFISRTELPSSSEILGAARSIEVASAEIEFDELLDNCERCYDVHTDLNCSGDIFESSSTVDQSLICCSTPLINRSC